MDNVDDQQMKQDLYKKLLKYPPFYTYPVHCNSLQDHLETRQRQITQWGEILHSYLKQRKILESSISELHNAPVICDNSSGVPKKLLKEELREILLGMEKLGSVEWKSDENFIVNWTSPYELADAIYAWAKSKKLIGYTETLKGIAQGDMTDKKESKPKVLE